MKLENLLIYIGEKINKEILINCVLKMNDKSNQNIWVGSRPGRGKGHDYPVQENTLRIDVSSGSMKKIDNLSMKNLSPLLLGPVYDLEGNEYIRFENLWQYNKVYPQLGHWDPIREEPTTKWYEWRNKGMTKVKNGKGIRTPDEISKLKKIGSWKPIGAWWNNKLLGYIDSRKQIYIPKYIEAIKKSEEYQVLENMVAKGTKILIIELDGPNLDEFPNGLLVTEKSINDALHNEKYPYGHGYVIAAQLAGF
jgi:hypothetical protein